MLTFIKICCPVCGKRLFDASSSATGTIAAYCKRCRSERLIKLEELKEKPHDLHYRR